MSYPLICLDTGTPAELWGTVDERSSVALHVLYVQDAGALTWTQLQFEGVAMVGGELKTGTYAVLDDYRTLVFKDPDTNLWSFQQVNVAVEAATSITPLECETTRKIWKEMTVDGQVAVNCKGIRPGMTVDGSVVPSFGPEATLTFSTDAGTRITLDVFNGIFYHADGPRQGRRYLVPAGATNMITSLTREGLHPCQALYLLDYAEKEQTALKEAEKKRNAKAFFDLVREPLHRKYCYFRSVRTPADLRHQQTDHSRFTDALLMHLRGRYRDSKGTILDHDDAMQEVMFTVAAVGDVPGLADTRGFLEMQTKIRDVLLNNQEAGSILFSGAKAAYVEYEVGEAVLTQEWWQLSNVFSYVTIDPSGTVAWYVGPQIGVLSGGAQIAAQVAISTSSALFVSLLVYVIKEEINKNKHERQLRQELLRRIRTDGEPFRVVGTGERLRAVALPADLPDDYWDVVDLFLDKTS